MKMSKKISLMLIFVMVVNMLFTFTVFANEVSTDEIIVETNSSNADIITVVDDAGGKLVATSMETYGTGDVVTLTLKNVQKAGLYKFYVNSVTKERVQFEVKRGSERYIQRNTDKILGDWNTMEAEWAQIGTVKLVGNENVLTITTNKQTVTKALKFVYVGADGEGITDDYNTFDTDQWTVSSKDTGVSATQGGVTLTTGQWFEYDVYTKTAQNVKLSLAAKTGTSGTPTSATVYVNGTIYSAAAVTSEKFPANTTGGTWTECAVVPLKADKNTIRVMNDGGANLGVEEIKLEKTSADAATGTIIPINKNSAGFEGTLNTTYYVANNGYVETIGGQKNSLTVNVAEAGLYVMDLYFGFTETTNCYTEIFVDDEKQAAPYIYESTGNLNHRAWRRIGSIKLNANDNKITIYTARRATMSALRLTKVDTNIDGDSKMFDTTKQTVTSSGGANPTNAGVTMPISTYIEYTVHSAKRQNCIISLKAKLTAANDKVYYNIYTAATSDVTNHTNKKYSDIPQITNAFLTSSTDYVDNQLGVITLMPGENTIKIFRKDAQSATNAVIESFTLTPTNEYFLTDSTLVRVDPFVVSGISPDLENGAKTSLLGSNLFYLYDTGWVELTVNTEKSQSYVLSTIGSIKADTTINIYVNGVMALEGIYFKDATTAWTTIGTVQLNPGSNVIRVEEAGRTTDFYFTNFKFDKAMTVTSFTEAGGTATAVVNKVNENASNALWIVVAQYSDADADGILKMESCKLEPVSLGTAAIGEATYTATLESYNPDLTTKAFLLDGATITPLCESK